MTLRLQNNDLFFKGLIRLVLGSVITLLGAFAYSVADISEIRLSIAAVILFLGVMPAATGVYYMVPFQYGSPWNTELRSLISVFEAYIVVATVIVLSGLPYQRNDVIWTLAILVVMLGVFYLMGLFGPKRKHGPVRPSYIDKLLKSKGIY